MMAEFIIDRKKIQQAYVRVCQDSGYKMPFDAAAHFVARMLGCHAFDVWGAIGDMKLMQDIATGKTQIDINEMKIIREEELDGIE